MAAGVVAVSITSAYRGGDAYGKRMGWVLAFHYDEALIARLKAEVPAGDREWWPSERCWWVAIEHEDALLRLMPSFEAYLQQGQLL